MSASYLIDSDWVIDHFNEVEKVTWKLEELAPEGLALSVISLAELYEGVFYSRNPEESQRILKQFLASDLLILAINEEICKVFGKERGKLRRKGKIIGSTCIYYDLILLTNNHSHTIRTQKNNLTESQ